MNILIIEDDLFLARNLAKLFEKKLDVNRLKIISKFSEFCREFPIINSYDIILVDILLGPLEKKSWLDMIALIREKNKKIPIIVISGYDDLSYLEKAFFLWASDYIIKPFRLNELEIRVQKWLSLYFYPDLSCYDELNYFWLKYNFSKNEFSYEWKILKLSKKAKYLLLLFLSEPEILLDENYLVEKIWGDVSYIIDRNLRVSIFRLKNMLKPYNLDLWINNVRWEWYIIKKT